MYPQQPCKSQCVKCTELKGNQTKEAPQAQSIRSGTPKYTHSSFSLDSPSVQNLCLKVAKNMTMTAVPICLHHWITISDIMNRASMFGKRIKYITSQPFPALSLTGTQKYNMDAPQQAQIWSKQAFPLYKYCQKNQTKYACQNISTFSTFSSQLASWLWSLCPL